MGDATPPTGPIQFGVFDLDIPAGELRKNGSRIKLQEQPFQILQLLLGRPGKIVTREEIQKKLWPDGTIVEFESSVNAAVKRLRDALGDSADNPRFVETLPRRGYRFIFPVTPPRGFEERNEESAKTAVVVLPFADISPQKDQEYFCDGMTEEIINALTKIEGLRVVSRVWAFQFKEAEKDIRQIGEQLNVSAAVEGSVRKDGQKLRITARLTHVSKGYHLWSDTYDRDLRDVFAIQEDISEAIVSTLKKKLKWKLRKESGPRLVLSKPSLTKNLKAYELYLKGGYFWNQKSEEGIKKSIECFQQAIEEDAGYALAYVGLANCYITLAGWDGDPVSRARWQHKSNKLIDEFTRLLIPEWISFPHSMDDGSTHRTNSPE